MLVPSMTNEEIIKELEFDYDIVRRKADYLSNNIRKRAIKSKKTIIESVKYTSPRKINWLFVFEVSKKMLYTSIYAYTTDNGFSAYGCVGDIRDGIILITKHFLERYNERFLKKPNLTKIDILSAFEERNGDMDLILRMGGENRIFSCVKDGVILGNNTMYGKYDVRVIKTFITNEMLFDSQEKEYNDIKKQFVKPPATPYKNMDKIFLEILNKQEKATYDYK